MKAWKRLLTSAIKVIKVKHWICINLHFDHCSQDTVSWSSLGGFQDEHYIKAKKCNNCTATIILTKYKCTLHNYLKNLLSLIKGWYSNYFSNYQIVLVSICLSSCTSLMNTKKILKWDLWKIHLMMHLAQKNPNLSNENCWNRRCHSPCFFDRHVQAVLEACI